VWLPFSVRRKIWSMAAPAPAILGISRNYIPVRIYIALIIEVSNTACESSPWISLSAFPFLATTHFTASTKAHCTNQKCKWSLIVTSYQLGRVRDDHLSRKFCRDPSRSVYLPLLLPHPCTLPWKQLSDMRSLVLLHIPGSLNTFGRLVVLSADGRTAFGATS
jgi:hypothetical protein